MQIAGKCLCAGTINKFIQSDFRCISIQSKVEASENGYYIVLITKAGDQSKVSKFFVGRYAGMTGFGYKYE